MDFGALFRSTGERGFMESPFFFGTLGGAMLCWAVYVLAKGEIPISKYGTSVATRAGDPGFYWFALLLISIMGGLALWQAVRQYRRNCE